MYVSAEVEDQEVVVEAMGYLYKNLPLVTFMNIINLIFENGDLYLRDWMGHVVSYTENKEFIPLLKYAISKEDSKLLKKYLERILYDLENTPIK